MTIPGATNRALILAPLSMCLPFRAAADGELALIHEGTHLRAEVGGGATVLVDNPAAPQVVLSAGFEVA